MCTYYVAAKFIESIDLSRSISFAVAKIKIANQVEERHGVSGGPDVIHIG